MSKQNSLLDLHIEDARWRKIPRLREKLARAAQVAFQNLPKKLRYPCAVTLLLTNDREMRQLNKDFRGKNKSTNVLSFPQFEAKALPKKGKKPALIVMGDVVLAYQYIVDEAKKGRKLLINHVLHLFLHGLLHLFGYDHLSERQAAKMEGLETRIMAKLGLPDPYQPVPMRDKTQKMQKKRKS